MTVVAGIAIDADEFALGQVLSHTTTRIELTQLVPVDGTLTPYFWTEVDGDTDAFEEQVRADDRVRSLTDLDGRVGARLYHIEWGEGTDGLLSALGDHDVLVEEAKSTPSGDRWLFHLRAWDQGELSAFQQACFDADVPLDVRRVHHNPDDSPFDSRLTEKQREAVLTALREGYFDVPHGTSQTDLADELGISRQSFVRRLKHAQRSVFEDLFWDDLDAE